MLKPEHTLIKKSETGFDKIRFPEMNFKWDLNLSHLIIILPLFVTGLGFLIHDHESISNVADSVKEMKDQTAKSIDDLRSNMNEQFHTVQTQISSLPDMRASAAQNERRIGIVEFNQGQFENKMTDLQIRVGTMEGKQREQVRQPKGL